MSVAEETLFVVVIDIPDAARRRRVRQILASFGTAIVHNAFEVPTTQRGIAVVTASLDMELDPVDRVRIYPVCRSCQNKVTLWGEGQLASLPVAHFF